MKPSIDEQIEAVNRAYYCVFNGEVCCVDEEHLLAALSTLQWVKRYAKPSLDALMAEFPGAKVAPQDQDD